MMDPALRSLGRAFFDAGGGRRLATGGAEEEGDDGDGAEARAGNRGRRSTLLQLLVARHGGEAAQALELGAGDALLLQGIFGARGRNLLSPAAAWLVKLEELTAHVAAHGALPLLRHPSLGMWIANQRRAHKAWQAGERCPYTMDDDRAAALEAVDGWAWDGNEVMFQAKLEELRAYVAAHGALPPLDYPSLGEWISLQRQVYKAWDKAGKPGGKAMNQDRVVLLEAFEGWAWDPVEATWQAKLAQLRAYVAAHGALPTRGKHVSLASWITTQRKAYRAWQAGGQCSNEMNDKRKAALEGVDGWKWESNTGPRPQ